LIFRPQSTLSSHAHRFICDHQLQKATPDSKQAISFPVLPGENILVCEYMGAPQQRVHLQSARLDHIADPLLQRDPPTAAHNRIVAWQNGQVVSAHAQQNPLSYGQALAQLARNATYAFKAERYNLGTSKAGSNNTLAPDGSSLPEVLSQIQPHPDKWRQFNDYVKLVFPKLAAISVVPIDQSQVQIQTWTQDPKDLPQELAIPLSDSGTGVGQVLSILAVLLTADFPRTIIIDEPQSFLHPGALRTLIQILADHSQHQFIIATHSPTVITASRPAELLRVIKPHAVSEVQILDSADNDDLRTFLRDVGARLSDVFGVEQILWVDGGTEEACFPEIMRASNASVLYGTKILGVEHTSDFDRYPRTVLQLYQRLTSGVGLLPAAVGFLFDRETRTDQDITDLRRQGHGKIDFLDRRMFENYLINPAAIAHVANSCQNFRTPAISEVEIQAWISKNGANPRFVSDTALAIQTPQWLAAVDGAKLLSGLFTELSETRCTYRKIEHGLQLTRFLLEHSPRNFDEITSKITALLQRETSLVKESDHTSHNKSLRGLIASP
jgi:hypothetical protein